MELLLLSMAMFGAAELPAGWAPDPLEFSHFPDRLHAYVWRNWQLVEPERLAEVIGATPDDIVAIGKAMGLADPPAISEEQARRTYITILRRNWHLLPYDQLCALVGWNRDQMDYTLREGDGLFWWFGSYKPKLEPLRYAPPTDVAKAREAEIAAIVREAFPAGIGQPSEALFSFIADLNKAPVEEAKPHDSAFAPKFCYSYYAPFRAPLTSGDDPWPDGYLARLASMGVDGVILHEPLFHLTEFPWDATVSAGYQARLAKLKDIATRARRHGMGLYLYLNEPRPMPMAFFAKHPELKGIDDTIIAGQQATMCTSIPEVQAYIRNGVAELCAAVPELGGIFTITASENYTNCWAHYSGQLCPRCSQRTPQEVIAEVNTLIADGIARSGSACRFIAWDWGWRDEWAEGIIQRLPAQTYLQSVSEWSIPIERGGIASAVGEYSLSTVGPGPRATRNWNLARARGLKTIAKIQTSNSWELASVPYIPVVENVANHIANLRQANIQGLMLSWTLGSYPSPSFDVVTEMTRKEAPSPEDAMRAVAARRFGEAIAPSVVQAWRAFSAAFREFPFDIGGLYGSAMLMGPANPLWAKPTGYGTRGTMAFAYPVDDIDTWRSIYPPEVYASQLSKVADGFDVAIAALTAALKTPTAASMKPEERAALDREIAVAEACAIHFRSTADQTRFVMLRNAILAEPGPPDSAHQNAGAKLDEIEAILRKEIELATRLWAIQDRDSRIGFEAACQYFYVGADLAEKVLNCRDLLARWVPAQRARLAATPAAK